ncbi:Mediator of RNA polymerase II transcription subunit 33A [Glycine max]|nr:Mediator of RNA polymerase II transcription subunit 33A [Glycine max]
MLPRGSNLHRDLGSLAAASASGFQLSPLPTTTPTCAGFFRDVPPRKVVLSIEDFGGVGDGKTSNTKSFRRAIRASRTAVGPSLISPPAVSISQAISHFFFTTVLLFSPFRLTEEYTRGCSFRFTCGSDLGQSGIVNGQGRMWWELWWNRTLEHTRGHLLELINSDNVLISNLTFQNSPFWTIHPECQLIEEAEHSPTNQGKNKLALRKCRAELITSLQLLGDYESLLTPPQLVLVEANQAAAKAIMFLSGNPVGSGCFKYMSTNDMQMKCFGNLRHLIVEAWEERGNGQGGSGANGTITGKACPKGLYDCIATAGAIMSIKNFNNLFNNSHQRLGAALYGVI